VLNQNPSPPYRTPSLKLPLGVVSVYVKSPLMNEGREFCCLCCTCFLSGCWGLLSQAARACAASYSRPAPRYPVRLGGGVPFFSLRPVLLKKETKGEGFPGTGKLGVIRGFVFPVKTEKTCGT